jgi:N-carbamoyl-L-amino-acid hydrolase
MEWRATDGAGIKQRYRGQLAPMGMIFVPSCDGISHSPKEFTAWVDVGNGAEVLYRTVVELDGEFNH